MALLLPPLSLWRQAQPARVYRRSPSSEAPPSPVTGWRLSKVITHHTHALLKQTAPRRAQYSHEAHALRSTSGSLVCGSSCVGTPAPELLLGSAPSAGPSCCSKFCTIAWFSRDSVTACNASPPVLETDAAAAFAFCLGAGAPPRPPPAEPPPLPPRRAWRPPPRFGPIFAVSVINRMAVCLAFWHSKGKALLGLTRTLAFLSTVTFMCARILARWENYMYTMKHKL